MKQQAKGFTARAVRITNIIIGIPYKKWCAWRLRRHTLNTLRHLSDAQLKDIGLTSHDVDRFR